jgi:hypothetical protein
MFFAKKKTIYWVHEPLATMALPLGSNICDENLFGPLRRNQNHKNTVPKFWKEENTLL